MPSDFHATDPKASTAAYKAFMDAANEAGAAMNMYGAFSEQFEKANAIAEQRLKEFNNLRGPKGSQWR